MIEKDWIDRARKQRELENDLKYGPIRPKTDKRCFRREMLEELLDGLNYCQWAFQKGEITRAQHKDINLDIRRAIGVIEIACLNRVQGYMTRGTVESPVLGHPEKR